MCYRIDRCILPRRLFSDDIPIRVSFFDFILVKAEFSVLAYYIIRKTRNLPRKTASETLSKHMEVIMKYISKIIAVAISTLTLVSGTISVAGAAEVKKCAQAKVICCSGTSCERVDKLLSKICKGNNCKISTKNQKKCCSCGNCRTKNVKHFSKKCGNKCGNAKATR